ncbi:MAG: glycosyltransferase [Phycisphaerales bacterium]
MTGLTVIIPVMDRPTVGETVASVARAAPDAAILIADGGTQCARTLACIRDAVSRYPRVKHEVIPQQPFNKARLLNAVVSHAGGRQLLFSDADIVWASDAVTSLYSAATSAGCDLVFVEHVTETQAAAGCRTIFVATATQTCEGFEVSLHSQAVGHTRPGFGLVLVGRDVFYSVGGFREDLVGYGFEDQDLLLRASLLGYSVSSTAGCQHITHADTERGDPLLLRKQRNANVLRSLSALARGALHGALATNASPVSHCTRVQICPEFMNELLESGVG